MPETPNYLADELRTLLAELGEPNLLPIARNRLQRLTEHVERLGDQPIEVDASTDLTVSSGLEPEQEIRAEAGDLAVRTSLGEARLLLRAAGHAELDHGGVSASVLDLADIWAAYITDGSKPGG